MAPGPAGRQHDATEGRTPPPPAKEPGIHSLSRRTLILGALGLGVAVLPRAGAAQDSALHVLKDPGCGCCEDWMRILRAAGFAVTFEDVPADELLRHKAARGIPPALVSCHTAEVGGYAIEGHVPPTDIRRLLALRPAAIGLAVPGMPFGAPGMGPADAREAYDVLLIRRDGRAEVFARYPVA